MRSRLLIAATLLIALVAACAPAENPALDAPAAGGSASSADAISLGDAASYDGLVTLFEESRVLNEPPVDADGIPDFSAAALTAQYDELRAYQQRLESFEIDDWSISDQVDYHLVRAELNGIEFMHRVMKPWTTSPYVYWGSSTTTSLPYYSFSDRPAVPEGPGWEELGFAGEPDFPLSEAEVDAYGTRLRALPKILAQGKANVVISEAKRDMGLMALRSLYVEGGLLEGMVEGMRQHHPELVADTEAA